MTRLGPLTSQALGRSPYDILVLGDGEANPREPPQDYDERGRPVNAETKRINRNIVRSHNEVMHVIGVAEPDSLITAESESDNQLIQQHLEDMLGRKLWDPARVIGALGVWGAEPLRQRALLYTQFSTYPPWRHFRQDYGLHPLFDILSSGVLASVVDRFLRHASLERKSIRENLWLRIATKYVRVHLQLFSCLQRLAIIPAFPWLPGPLYFVPFSSDSPIARPPILPTSYSFGGVAEWVGQVLFCVAPIAVFYGYTELREQLSHHLNYAIYDTLNTPSNPPLQRPVSEFNPYTGERRLAGLPNVEVLPPRPPVPPPPPPQQQTQTRTRPAVPPPPADSQRLLSEGDEHNDSNRRNAIDGVQDAVAVDESANERAGEASGSSETTPTQQQHRTSTTPPPGSPTNAPRRRNTVSSGGGGDGYISEEEEFELSATLVSFDVEAGSAGDAPPNAWSAELRQSATVSIGYEGDGYGPFGGSPSLGTYLRGVYYPGVNAPFNSDTMLSRLPAAILSDNAASLAAKLLLVDCEAAVVRLMARGYRLQHGQRVDDLYDLGTVPFPFVPGGTFSLSAANHYAMAIVLEAAVKSVGVLAALGISWLYRGSQQGWSFMRVVREKLKLYGAQKRESDPIDVV